MWSGRSFSFPGIVGLLCADVIPVILYRLGGASGEIEAIDSFSSFWLSKQFNCFVSVCASAIVCEWRRGSQTSVFVDRPDIGWLSIYYTVLRWLNSKQRPKTYNPKLMCACACAYACVGGGFHGLRVFYSLWNSSCFLIQSFSFIPLVLSLLLLFHFRFRHGWFFFTLFACVGQCYRMCRLSAMCMAFGCSSNFHYLGGCNVCFVYDVTFSIYTSSAFIHSQLADDEWTARQ